MELDCQGSTSTSDMDMDQKVAYNNWNSDLTVKCHVDESKQIYGNTIFEDFSHSVIVENQNHVFSLVTNDPKNCNENTYLTVSWAKPWT